MGKLETCFAFTVMRADTEGGARFSNRASDPGGATKYGISLKHRAAEIGDLDHDGDIDATDVRLLTEGDAKRIFERCYFAPLHADLLPAPLALMLVDFAYNGGPAVKLLQERLGVTPDGAIGPRTAALANALSPDAMRAVINAYGAARLSYLQSLPTWGQNPGWNTRVHLCMDEARKLMEV
jgi:lysozyme family protein